MAGAGESDRGTWIGGTVADHVDVLGVPPCGETWEAAHRLSVLLEHWRVSCGVLGVDGHAAVSLAWLGALLSDAHEYPLCMHDVTADCVVIVVLLLVVLPAVPESPRYLFIQGKEHKAMEVLKLISRINGKSLPAGLKLKAGSPSDVTAASDAPSPNKVALLDRFWTLLAYPLNHITPYIWTLWPMLALGYYSIVILTTSLQADSQNDDETCVDGHVSLSQNDYLSIFIDSTAEVSSTLMCLLVIEYTGRKRCDRGGTRVLLGGVM